MTKAITISLTNSLEKSLRTPTHEQLTDIPGAGGAFHTAHLLLQRRRQHWWRIGMIGFVFTDLGIQRHDVLVRYIRMEVVVAQFKIYNQQDEDSGTDTGSQPQDIQDAKKLVALQIAEKDFDRIL